MEIRVFKFIQVWTLHIISEISENFSSFLQTFTNEVFTSKNFLMDKILDLVTH